MISGAGNNESGVGEFTLSRGRLLVLSLVSGVIYVGIGWVLYHFAFDRSFLSMFEARRSLAVQFVYGCGYGVIASGIIGGLFFRTSLRTVLSDYEIVRYILRLRLRIVDILQISTVAGVTEEILFRGAIQPLIGIWWTSILFVGLHGYFKWKSVYHLLFGGLMFALSVGLGYLSRDVGLVAAMAGHGMYDLLMLLVVNRRK
jgi:hypothetical protein